MPDLSMLLHNLPDFSALLGRLWEFVRDQAVTLSLMGWFLTTVVMGLIIKYSIKLVFGVIWSGVKFIVYWAFLWPLTRIGYGVWVVFKWLGRLFGRGAKASGRGVKAVGRRGKTSFKHHPWWGIGLLIVGAMLAHAYAPNYSERGAVNTTLQSLLTLYIIVAAFFLMLRKMFNRRRTVHRG